MTPYILNVTQAMLRKMRRAISIVILFAFSLTSVPSPSYAQVDPIPFMPVPGAMVHLSPQFSPAYLKGIVVHPENPFKFDFIVYRGDKPLSDVQKRAEYTKLTKYFLASMAIPDDDQWVNLSPYEKDRIIKDDFGKTEMGRDLLAQDYLLKQITASLIYPQDSLGKRFWDKIYVQAQKQYGTTNIPVNTFNKVWILPDDALIYEKSNVNKPGIDKQGTGNITAYVLKNHLRVMLEEDYLSLQKHTGIERVPANKTHSIASKIVREIVLPELQKEVNEGANFAPLRQVYSGMLLATWFKRTLKQSVLGQIYANKGKVKGIDQDPRINEEIYERYLQAYKKGVFNYIKEDTDRLTNETVSRKYFSGGTGDFAMASEVFHHDVVEITHDDAKGEQSEIRAIPSLDVADFAMSEVTPVGWPYNLESRKVITPDGTGVVIGITAIAGIKFKITVKLDGGATISYLGPSATPEKIRVTDEGASIPEDQGAREEKKQFSFEQRLNKLKSEIRPIFSEELDVGFPITDGLLKMVVLIGHEQEFLDWLEFGTPNPYVDLFRKMSSLGSLYIDQLIKQGPDLLSLSDIFDLDEEMAFWNEALFNSRNEGISLKNLDQIRRLVPLLRKVFDGLIIYMGDKSRHVEFVEFVINNIDRIDINQIEEMESLFKQGSREDLMQLYYLIYFGRKIDLNGLSELYHGSPVNVIKDIIFDSNGIIDFSKSGSEMGDNYFSFDKGVSEGFGFVLAFDVPKLVALNVRLELGSSVLEREYTTQSAIPLTALTENSKKELIQMFKSDNEDNNKKLMTALYGNEAMVASEQGEIDYVVQTVWQRLHGIGSIDEIRKMDLEEFAHRAGVHIISHTGLPTPIITISKDQFESIKQYRSTNTMPTATSAIDLVNNMEINGPGIYMSLQEADSIHKALEIKNDPARYNKGSIFHELMEDAFAQAGLVDEVLSFFRGHTQARVLEEEILFDALMGPEAIGETQAIFSHQFDFEGYLLDVVPDIHFEKLGESYKNSHRAITKQKLASSLGKDSPYYQTLAWAVNSYPDVLMEAAKQRVNSSNFESFVGINPAMVATGGRPKAQNDRAMINAFDEFRTEFIKTIEAREFLGYVGRVIKHLVLDDVETTFDVLSGGFIRHFIVGNAVSVKHYGAGVAGFIHVHSHPFTGGTHILPTIEDINVWREHGYLFGMIIAGTPKDGFYGFIYDVDRMSLQYSTRGNLREDNEIVFDLKKQGILKIYHITFNHLVRYGFDEVVNSNEAPQISLEDVTQQEIQSILVMGEEELGAIEKKREERWTINDFKQFETMNHFELISSALPRILKDLRSWLWQYVSYAVNPQEYLGITSSLKREQIRLDALLKACLERTDYDFINDPFEPVKMVRLSLILTEVVQGEIVGLGEPLTEGSLQPRAIRKYLKEFLLKLDMPLRVGEFFQVIEEPLKIKNVEELDHYLYQDDLIGLAKHKLLDFAQTSVIQRDPGGIDMNSANLAMTIKRDGKGVPLPVSQQNLENIHIDGLVPVILQIQPASATNILSQFTTNSLPKPANDNLPAVILKAG